jgi:hypothetical protein
MNVNAAVRTRFVTIAAWALLAAAGCAKEDANSNGNGPGDADGFGGREDASNTPAARDAAPGRLSETSPPSPPANDPPKDDTAADSQ